MLPIHRTLPERQPTITGGDRFIYLSASFLLVYWIIGCGQKDRVFFIELWIHDLFPTIAGKPKRSSGHQNGSKILPVRGVLLGSFDPGAALLDMRTRKAFLRE